MPMGIGLGIGVTRGGGVGWWPAGSELALEFDNGRGFNSIDRTKTTPDSILTYTSPSPKLVYGSDGVLRYANHNLLLQSQTFETASWTKGNCTVTANAAVAPDGTTTADLIIPNAASAAYKTVQHADVNPGVAVATASIYAKPNGYGFISFVATGSLGRLTIELSTGAYTNYGAALTATSTAVGDGWYRVVVNVPNWTSLAAAWWGSNSAQRDPASSWTSDGVSGAYLWGAQLNRGSSALTYLPTTTAAVYSLPIDHDPVTHEALGVLIEEQRTNLLLQSQTFDNATWLKSGTNTAATANAAVAPDGTTTADLLIPGTTAANHDFQQTPTAAAVSYTLSVYAKAENYSWVCLTYYDGAVDRQAYFNVLSGVIGSVYNSPGAVIQSVGNGWYRVSITFTGVVGRDQFLITPCPSDGGRAAISNGTSGIYIWGAQLEAGAFPTSYIPTVASQVTRAADQVSILTSAFAYNAAEGTMVVEARVNALKSATNRIASLYGPASRLADLYVTVDSNLVYYKTSDSSQVTIGPGVAAQTPFKGGIAYKLNDYQGVLGGTLGGADTSTGALPTNTSTLGIGNWNNDSASILSGHIKRLTYFPTRRSNADLQVLTT